MAKKNAKRNKKKSAKDVSIKKLKVQEDKKYEVPESHEWYRAEFVDANLADGKWGPVVHLKFKLLSGETEEGNSAEGCEARAMTGADLTPSSPLMDYVTTFNGGEEPDIDDDVDLTVYYGEEYDVHVQVTEPKGDDDRRYANVVKIAEAGTKIQLEDKPTKKRRSSKKSSSKKRRSSKKSSSKKRRNKKRA